MSDLAQHIFSQITEANRAAAEHIRIGRQHFARDVESWIERNTDKATGMAHTETLLALCRKERD